MTTVDELVVY